MFNTSEDRGRFFYNLGVFYAGLGGTFGAYKRAAPAFLNAKNLHLYKNVNVKFVDFPNFNKGFNSFQTLRNAMTLEKVRAGEEMRTLLASVNLTGTELSTAKHWTELGEGKI